MFYFMCVVYSPVNRTHKQHHFLQEMYIFRLERSLEFPLEEAFKYTSPPLTTTAGGRGDGSWSNSTVLKVAAGFCDGSGKPQKCGWEECSSGCNEI